ncbi:unnamed protein product [Arctogadus glacialis]
MGKPLSRPDCLRQNPRCLGKGDEEEAYIEDCYVPQRSIYDTMRINEQIDQGTKLNQPSRGTLGSGGEGRGEGSTLSSNGTIGTDIGSVFLPRHPDNTGVKRLDERVIFDALKLTGDPQTMSPLVGLVSSGLSITPSTSASSGVAAVAKRRHQGSDKKDNPNRRSWKAFMPPSYPEFAERLEFSPAESAEKRLSGAGIPLSPLQPFPPLPQTLPTSSAPPVPPHRSSPLSSASHTPPVSSSASTPTASPVPPLQHHPPSRQKQLHPLLQKHQKQTRALPSPSKEHPAACGLVPTAQASGSTSPTNTPTSRHVGRRKENYRRPTASPKAVPRRILEEPVEVPKTSDSESDSAPLEQDQGDNAPLLPPRPVFCPPTKSRTWPRGLTSSRKNQVGLRHNFPVLPPLPPLIGEDSDMDDESVYLLEPPSPFLQEEVGMVYGGLPLTPCVSQEGTGEGLLGWGSELRERTASELKFEEDELRILAELEEDRNPPQDADELRNTIEMEEAERIEEEKRVQREEREWEAVLKIENREIIDLSWDKETLESESWDITGSSGHWPLLTPPMGFGGSEVPSTSPCQSSGSESDDLFLELERQCLEDLGAEGEEMNVDSEPLDPYALPRWEEEAKQSELIVQTDFIDLEGTLPLDSVHRETPDVYEPQLKDSRTDSEVDPSESIEKMFFKYQHFDSMRTRDHENEHGFIDDSYDIEYAEGKVLEEDCSYPTDSFLRQIPESDSSGFPMSSQPEGTATSDRTQQQPAEAETDQDSGALSGRECEDVGSDREEDEPFQRTSLSSCSPYEEEEEGEEEEVENKAWELDEEAEMETAEWDAYDQSEPSLDSTDEPQEKQSLENLHMKENERQIDQDCTQDVDVETSCQEEQVSPESIHVAVEMTFEPEAPLLSSESLGALDATDVAWGGSVSEEASEEKDTESPTMVTSTPKSDDTPNSDLDTAHSVPLSPSLESPFKEDYDGAGLASKDSEAFVVSDSFVYLAVSAPPQSAVDGPPFPMEAASTPPSPVLKQITCPQPEEDDEEERAFLCSDSFIYLAAPERPHPGPSDGSSACEEAQELDLDSYSEGTQSGMDGVDFAVGSMTGDSDWESDDPALDPPPRPHSFVAGDQAWELLEGGLLGELFSLTEDHQDQTCRPQGEGSGSGSNTCDTNPLPESDEELDKSATPLPCSDIDAQVEALEREQVDGIQPRLKHVNAVGQGLIQSAAKHTDTQALEHDLENTNLQWNSLNKRVAERIAQLQEALLHCGKFEDALEPLLSWLSDTEELVANQKPPSAEYRVVKAQIQEQKLLQRLLDDRRPTVQMIQAEGERIAATADAQDRDKIQSQLQSLGERWTELLDKASGRQRKLEELQGLAFQFHEALEPLGEWLSATERRLTSAEPMGTQTAKISQQISKHKVRARWGPAGQSPVWWVGGRGWGVVVAARERTPVEMKESKVPVPQRRRASEQGIRGPRLFIRPCSLFISFNFALCVF